jgi:hypothetical protein
MLYADDEAELVSARDKTIRVNAIKVMISGGRYSRKSTAAQYSIRRRSVFGALLRSFSTYLLAINRTDLAAIKNNKRYRNTEKKPGLIFNSNRMDDCPRRCRR